MAEAKLDVDIIANAEIWRGHENLLASALAAAAQHEGKSGEVALMLGDDMTVAKLNKDFRGKDGPTNVLSFPPAFGESDDGFLGDIILAAETVAVEAEFQGKRFEHHAAHLVVHGFLHLLGYDHLATDQAEAMEARERTILASLGIPDPYA